MGGAGDTDVTVHFTPGSPGPETVAEPRNFERVVLEGVVMDPEAEIGPFPEPGPDPDEDPRPES
jgi:hypothetical protein